MENLVQGERVRFIIRTISDRESPGHEFSANVLLPEIKLKFL